MATIGLEGICFRSPHGYYPEEQYTGNNFIIDLYVQTDTTRAAMQDDLNAAVNYGTLYLLVKAEMRKPTLLIETLAHNIVSRVKEQFSTVTGVRLVLRKLHPPVGGEVAAAYIELTTGSLAASGGSRSPMRF